MEELKISQWGEPPDQLELGPGDVHVWHAAEHPKWADVERMRRDLSCSERRHLKRDAAPKRYAAGRHLVRTLLGRYLDRPPRKVRLREGASGRLEVRGGGDAARLHFEIAIVPGRALFVVSASHRLALEVAPIPDEQDVVAALDEMPDRQRRLVEFLSARNQVRAVAGHRAEQGAQKRLREFVAADGTGAADCRVERLQLGKGYVAAVAAEGTDWSPTYWRYRREGQEAVADEENE